jgi:hypothetical protein
VKDVGGTNAVSARLVRRTNSVMTQMRHIAWNISWATWRDVRQELQGAPRPAAGQLGVISGRLVTAQVPLMSLHNDHAHVLNANDSPRYHDGASVQFCMQSARAMLQANHVKRAPRGARSS